MAAIDINSYGVTSTDIFNVTGAVACVVVSATLITLMVKKLLNKETAAPASSAPTVIPLVTDLTAPIRAKVTEILEIETRNRVLETDINASIIEARAFKGGFTWKDKLAYRTCLHRIGLGSAQVGEVLNREWFTVYGNRIRLPVDAKYAELIKHIETKLLESNPVNDLVAAYYQQGLSKAITEAKTAIRAFISAKLSAQQAKAIASGNKDTVDAAEAETAAHKAAKTAIEEVNALIDTINSTIQTTGAQSSITKLNITLESLASPSAASTSTAPSTDETVTDAIKEVNTTRQAVRAALKKRIVKLFKDEATEVCPANSSPPAKLADKVRAHLETINT